MDPDDPDPPSPETQILLDDTREILSQNDSPDLSFEHGINPYRGCTHGCVYCTSPRTPVLHSDLVWRPIGEIHEGDEIVFLKVDEKGTEAAAVTSVEVSVTSAPIPLTVRADRPFLLAIRKRLSGTVLFAGLIVEAPACLPWTRAISKPWRTPRR